MKLFIIMILFMMSCNPPMDTHICTKEQMDKVEKEVKFCVDKINYGSSVCYNSAIRRNCEKRDSDETIKE